MGNRKVRAVHRVAIYAINADPASAAEAEKLAKLWYDVHKEDHAMYERLQAGGHPTSPPTGEVLSPRGLILPENYNLSLCQIGGSLRRCWRILVMSAGSVTAAMTRTGPARAADSISSRSRTPGRCTLHPGHGGGGQ